MAEADIDTKTALQEIYKSREVKDSWFNSYIRGNSRVPQTNRVGTGLMLTTAVINDLPDSWDGFFDSEVTDKQIQLMGNAMDSHHRQAEVRYSTKPVLSKEATWKQRIVSYVKGEKRYQIKPERLQGLWNATTRVTGCITLGYIHGRQYSDDHVLEARDSNEIKAFFANPRTAHRVDQFRQTLQLASDALTDDVGIEMSDNYKKAVSANSLEPMRWLNEIKQHSLAAVHEHFPDEKLEWLYGYDK
jgi:hypothetical protein